MKKTILLLEVKYDWAGMTVVQLTPYASNIRNKVLADPEIHVDAGLTTSLGTQITNLGITLADRETDKSTELTLLEGTQATDIMITVEKIGAEVQKQANDLYPGNEDKIKAVFARIGFAWKDKAGSQDRGFEVYETFYRGVKIRIKAEKQGTTYNFRWSVDGISWKEILAINVSHLSITDLPASTKISFQYAITPPMGLNASVSVDAELEWSDTITGTTK